MTTRSSERRLWGLLGLCLFFVSACSAILGIEDRELREDVDGEGGNGTGGDGFVGQTGGGGSGGRVDVPPPTGGGTIDPPFGGYGGDYYVPPIETCGAYGDACTDCACTTCGPAVTECFRYSDCGPFIRCIGATRCADRGDCVSVCGGLASRAGMPDSVVSELEACLSGDPCPACADADPAMLQCLGQNPDSSCWGCMCGSCTAYYGGLEGCMNGSACEQLAACVSQTGCSDPYDCQVQCGGLVDAVGPSASTGIIDCLRYTTCAACDAVPYTVPPRCTDWFGQSPNCGSCVCNQCDATLLSECETVDCMIMAQCIVQTGCAADECDSGRYCLDVFDYVGASPGLRNELSNCVASGGCTECGYADPSYSSDRARCAEAMPRRPCWGCVCATCDTSMLEQCFSYGGCNEVYQCISGSGCDPTMPAGPGSCLDVCGPIATQWGVSTSIIDELAGCTCSMCQEELLASACGASCAIPGQEGICRDGIMLCDDQFNMQPCMQVHFGVPEACGNLLDDNCDGNTDEGCP